VNKWLNFSGNLKPVRQLAGLIATLVRRALAEVCTVPVLLVVLLILSMSPQVACQSFSHIMLKCDNIIRRTQHLLCSRDKYDTCYGPTCPRLIPSVYIAVPHLIRSMTSLHSHVLTMWLEVTNVIPVMTTLNVLFTHLSQFSEVTTSMVLSAFLQHFWRGYCFDQCLSFCLLANSALMLLVGH